MFNIKFTKEKPDLITGSEKKSMMPSGYFVNPEDGSMDENRRNDDALFAALNKAKKRKRRRRWITVLVILAVIATALMLVVNSLRKKVEASLAVEGDEVKTYNVSYGSISTRVSGSGTIEDVDTETITVPEGVEVEEVVVKSNTKLQKDDVIARLDLTSVLSSMASVQEEIKEMDEELQKAGGDRVASYVTAGASGRIKRVYVEKGTDVVSCMIENGALALVSLDGKMAVDFECTGLSTGDKVKVERTDGNVIEGSVEKTVGSAVTVLVTDNGPALDEAVRILDEAGKELGKGTLYIHSLFRVTGFTGTVAGVTARENQQVYAASTICSLTDTAYSAHYNSILKQRKEKEETLLELLGLYQGGALRAPYEGTVLKIDFDEKTNTESSAAASSAQSADPYAFYYNMGSSAVSATAGSTDISDSEKTDGIAVVTMSPDVSMLVKLSVDEADILSLEKGQMAEITIESIGEEKLGGVVTDIDKTANSSAGVTSYTAEITFLKSRGMLSGMSADVVINIQGTENVLLVPTEAIRKTSAGAFVYTSYDEETKLFGGIVPVEVGISNDEFTEVRSGLDEGTTVYYTEKERNDFFMMMGGPGGSGRRPSGGYYG